ncbi:Fanconi anemia group I protein [Impatiens glandulifera]|uniref:Fanconi anemia group I protein n=1 Tax=Impatiens glandulifera TaxID=253017 RepID=UPI001FB0CB1D|nr:Fanconi anemia group I protein [Impatiens glandulifera]
MAGSHIHGASPPTELTDVDIVRLVKQPYEAQIHVLNFLTSPDSHETLISFLHSRAASPTASISVAEYVSSLISLLSIAPQSDNFPSTLHALLLLSYITLFTSHKIPHDRNSLNTIHLFAVHLESIPSKGLVSVSDSIVSSLSTILDAEDAQLVHLLPKCLNLIMNSNEIEKRADLINSVLDRFLTCDWSKALLLEIVLVIREFGFIDRRRQMEFLEKVFDGMKNVDLQDLPSLVYQLLVLASKGFSKTDIIEGIVMFFGTKVGSKASSIGRQVEGTVLLHVNFAVKQDPSIGNTIMGLVKSNIQAFNHFTVSVLLSIARVRRFKERSLQILKTAVVTAYHDNKSAKTCKWLSNELKEEHLQKTKIVEKTVLRAINESNCGREHILPSIVEFGFALLETVEQGSGKRMTKSDDLSVENLGLQVLKTLFEVHDMARNEIIDQCKFRILSLKPEKSLSVLRLLDDLVKRYPYALSEHIPRLKELLDYFTFMPDRVSSHLVTLLLPLIKYSGDLQDYIILVVRKAMFNREESVRLAATSAIISLILADKQSETKGTSSIQESSSQASSSQQHPAIPPGKRAGLFQELSCLLQRCLYQQAHVKEILYSGLVKLVLLDPLSSGAVFDFLFPHFLRYYNEKADIQLRIDECVKTENGRIYIEEPLDCLLSCISWVLLTQPHGKTDNQSASWVCSGFALTQENEVGKKVPAELFSRSFSIIREFLKNKNLEDLLGLTLDTSSTTEGEKESRCRALILSGMIKVLLNFIITELEKQKDEKNEDLQKEVIKFVLIHESLEKHRCMSRPGKGIRKLKVQSSDNTQEDTDKNSTKFSQERTPLMATSSICQLLQIGIKSCQSHKIENVQSSENDSQQPFSKNHCSQFLSFVLNTSLHQIKSFPSQERNDPINHLIYGNINAFGPLLLKLIWLLKSPNKLATTDQKKKETKGRKDDDKGILISALVCLKELISLTPDQKGLIEDLVSISPLDHTSEFVPDEDHLDEHVSVYSDSIEVFVRKHIKPLLSDFLEVPLPHEVEILCDIIMVIGNELPYDRRHSIGHWAIGISKIKGIQNPKTAKSIVSLGINLSSSPHDVAHAQDIAAELLKIMSSATDGQMEISNIYPLINHSTHATLVSYILQYIEGVVADIDRVTMKLKMYIGLALEEAIYSRTEAAVKVLSSLVMMKLMDFQAENLLRLAARLYKNLARMSKMRIASKGCKQLFPSLSYQKLVETTCKLLTGPLYNFVSDMQQNQEGSGKGKGKGVINRIKRENRCIPDLIFQIEDYERYLIILSKASNVNLLRHAKRSTARDFKILDPEPMVEEEEEDEAGGGDQEGGSPAASSSQNEEDDEADRPQENTESGDDMVPESESDEDRNSLTSSKRARMSKTMLDNDDEEE